jgi:hypothetical protein
MIHSTTTTTTALSPSLGQVSQNCRGGGRKQQDTTRIKKLE